MLNRIKKLLTGNSPIEDEADKVSVSGDILVYEDENGTKPMLEGRRISVEISEEAKIDIARKIARLLPDLVISKKIQLLEYTLRVIKALSNEQASRVKAVISEELKDSESAPHELVIMLAWDKDIEVSRPVLEFSPVLSDDDLVEIIIKSSINEAIEAISRRRRLSSRITGAIIGRRNNRAITNVLANPDAEISENSYEQIIDQAPENESFYEPLLNRLDLTSRLVNRVAASVSESMLQKMLENGVISSKTAESMRNNIKARFTSDSANRRLVAEREVASQLQNNGLTHEEIANALARSDKEYVISALVTLSGIARETVERIMRSENAKAVCALCYRAKLPMRLAVQVQHRLAGIHHTKVLNARNGEDYPLTPSQMNGFLEIFGS